MLILLFALLHAAPVLWVASKRPPAALLWLTAAIMIGIAVVIGGPQYGVLDSFVVVVALLTARRIWPVSRTAPDNLPQAAPPAPQPQIESVSPARTFQVSPPQRSSTGRIRAAVVGGLIGAAVMHFAGGRNIPQDAPATAKTSHSLTKPPSANAPHTR